MLQVSWIRENREKLEIGYQKRNLKADVLLLVDEAIQIDDQRKSLQTILDAALAGINEKSRVIGEMMKSGQAAAALPLKEEVTNIKSSISQWEADLKEHNLNLENILLSLPNVPHESVPFGKEAEDNEVFRPWPNALPDLGPDALPHWELSNKYGIFDLPLGVKLTGAGFPVFRGKGARLERALINYFLDRATAAGFEEINPPLLVNKESARGTGQIPDKDAQMYYVERDDFYLIPTAEVPITNIYRDVIVDEKQFPIKMCGYTPCFRREAGSYGAHVKGLNRVHQFNKVEIVQIEHPDKSYDTLMQMLEHVATLLDELGLPFRILRLCGGDIGNASALTFDFEVWSAAQQRWLEVSSVSNFETYQANRMKCRFRDSNGKMQLVHTLNGSALALARIVACIIENNQTPEGISMPDILVPYTGFAILD
ncbi:MAG: serine--tRNA ligase [Saprospiraceae bacterium]